MSYIIGIDLGTSSIKALLLSDGKIVDQKSETYSPDFLDKGFVEQDPSVWWDATQKALAALAAANPHAKGSIAALACSGQMHSSVFLDKNGRVIRKAILWNDTRTTKQTADIAAAVGEQKMLDNVCNRALEGFTLPKILWLRDNEPDNFAKVDKVIMPKDFINYQLTGRIVTEVSDAAGTVLFDVKAKRWSQTLADALNLPTRILPDVIESTGLVGTVKPDLAESLGLSPDTKVIAGGADNSCAAIGNGVVEKGQAVISIGTSGTVVAMLDDISGKVTGDVHLFNYSYPNKFYAMGCMLGAGESLNWFKSIISKSYDELNQLAAAAPAGSRGVVFLPYLFGERCPFSDPHARGIFFGLSSQTGQAEMVRAVMEGVAFNIRAMFDLVLGFTKITDIYITGGGAKSEIWGQIIADIIGKPISVLNIEEGPAFGAALIAGVGADIYSSFKEAKTKMLAVERTIAPQNFSVYTVQYDTFRKLYQANKELFSK